MKSVSKGELNHYTDWCSSISLHQNMIDSFACYDIEFKSFTNFMNMCITVYYMRSNKIN